MPHAHSVSKRRTRLAVERLEDRYVPSTAQYVAALYQDLLQRAAQPSELTFWVNQINSGVNPQQVALDFVGSPEYVSLQIRADYEAYLARDPSPPELAFWLGQRENGLSGQSEAANFLASNEYFLANGGNNSSWVNAVYQQALGRPADPAGLNTWLTSLNLGASRFGVATGILSSPETHARVVDADFLRILGRNADQTGLAVFTEALNLGMPASTLVADLASSPEFIAGKAGALDISTAGETPVIAIPTLPPTVTSVTTMVPTTTTVPGTVVNTTPGNLVNSPGVGGSAFNPVPQPGVTSTNFFPATPGIVSGATFSPTNPGIVSGSTFFPNTGVNTGGTMFFPSTTSTAGATTTPVLIPGITTTTVLTPVTTTVLTPVTTTTVTPTPAPPAPNFVGFPTNAFVLLTNSPVTFGPQGVSPFLGSLGG